MTPTPPLPTDPSSTPWRAVAPAVFDLADLIEVRARRSIDPAVLVPVRAAVTTILGPDGTAGDDDLPADARHADGARALEPGDVAACVAFAEQFVVDVASTTDEQRAAMSAAMGADAFAFVQVVYVTDVFRRAHLGLRRLFGDAGADDGVRAAPTPSTTTTAAGPSAAAPNSVDPQATAADLDGGSADLWTLLGRFMQEVALLDALDPVISELVRLQGARVHDCRLCQSRLSVRALDASGDAAVFAPGSAGRPGLLDDRARVALRLTDALVTQPSSIDAALAGEVHAAFTTAEIVEIVLDVVRNAANKIAVAFGADAPVVTSGVEYYDIDAAGEVVADVDMTVVRAATAR